MPDDPAPCTHDQGKVAGCAGSVSRNCWWNSMGLRRSFREEGSCPGASSAGWAGSAPSLLPPPVFGRIPHGAARHRGELATGRAWEGGKGWLHRGPGEFRERLRASSVRGSGWLRRGPDGSVRGPDGSVRWPGWLREMALPLVTPDNLPYGSSGRISGAQACSPLWSG